MIIENKMYFYRTAIFTRKDNQVALADIDSPENTTPLDHWLGTVISLADGHHSIQELIDYLRSHYPTPPAELEKTVHSVIERLLEGQLIKLTDSPVELPYYLAEPLETLNLKEAKRLIKEDGYRQH